MNTDNEYCYECYKAEDGICSECALDFNVCLNCVIYAGPGELCANCETMGDEGCCMMMDRDAAREYIETIWEFFEIQYGYDEDFDY